MSYMPFFKNILFAIFLITICILPSRAQPIEPVKTLDVYQTITPPILDGLADDCYGPLQETEDTNPYTSYFRWEGPLDMTANFRLSWDPKYLYLLAQITDDVEHNYSWDYSANPRHFDSFEVFLQLDTATVPSTYNSTTVHLIFNRGLDSVMWAGRAKRSDFGYFMNRRDRRIKGWSCEIAIPWKAVYSSGDNPENIMDYIDDTVIGFEFIASDSDNSDGVDSIGNRKYQVSWDLDGQDGTEDIAWDYTSVFGYITLISYENYLSNNTIAIKETLIHPNPASNYIELNSIYTETHIIIYNLLGKALINTSCEPNSLLDISGLESGMYIVKLDSGASLQFVKE